MFVRVHFQKTRDHEPSLGTARFLWGCNESLSSCEVKRYVISKKFLCNWLHEQRKGPWEIEVIAQWSQHSWLWCWHVSCAPCLAENALCWTAERRKSLLQKHSIPRLKTKLNSLGRPQKTCGLWKHWETITHRRRTQSWTLFSFLGWRAFGIHQTHLRSCSQQDWACASHWGTPIQCSPWQKMQISKPQWCAGQTLYWFHPAQMNPFKYGTVCIASEGTTSANRL